MGVSFAANKENLEKFTKGVEERLAKSAFLGGDSPSEEDHIAYMYCFEDMGNEKMPCSMEYHPEEATNPKICAWRDAMKPLYKKPKLY